ncbi:hypothetical protein B296_00058251 [Ensete ventricosum]|uniref:Uncharacterized protein n=1 Tax=Ensete ventricosum TaxID=4639 RepID=A0A426XMX4_ENSVE|nr:hypothetical protein B296_00058251 [Ensete ventricosum]
MEQLNLDQPNGLHLDQVVLHCADHFRPMATPFLLSRFCSRSSRNYSAASTTDFSIASRADLTCVGLHAGLYAKRRSEEVNIEGDGDPTIARSRSFKSIETFELGSNLHVSEDYAVTILQRHR